MSRRAYYLVLLGVYVALYGRSLAWGWTGMDDSLLLENNPYLGHGYSNFVWGFGDVSFGRRWMPGLWTVANLFSGWGPVGFRLGTFVLGAGLCLSVLRLLEERAETRIAVWGALLFAISPLRWETFGWGIGFVYTGTALLCVWAIIFHLEGKRLFAGLAIVGGLLVYPQAAGVALVLVWLWRKTWSGFALLAALAVLVFVQWKLRAAIGYVPVQGTVDYAFCAVGHYAVSLLYPLSTVPVVSPGWHWGVPVGFALIGLGLAVFPRQVAICACVFAPVLLAAVTESFWYAGRYSLLLSIAAAFFACRWLGTQGRAVSAVMACGFLSLSVTHQGFESREAAIRRGTAESILLHGRPPEFRVPRKENNFGHDAQTDTRAASVIRM